jgi:hypothetical protein
VAAVNALEALHPLVGQHVRVTVGPAAGLALPLCSFSGRLVAGIEPTAGEVTFYLGDPATGQASAPHTYFVVVDGADASTTGGGVSIVQGGVRLLVESVREGR